VSTGGRIAPRAGTALASGTDHGATTPSAGDSTSGPAGGKRRILVVAGEASGDQHAANWVREARKLEPSARFVGLGGPRMRAEGVEVLVDSEEVAVVGLVEVLAHLGAIVRAFLTLVSFARRERPELAVLVDFPDFNLLLARVLHRLGVPIVYYVSPQLWAWRRGRVKLIARLVRRMLVIFPFEAEFYRSHGVDVRFVGHPLADAPLADRSAEDTRAALGLAAGERLVALLPGSRRGEVRRLLPPMLEAAGRLAQQRPDLRFALPLADTLAEADVAPLLASSPVPVEVRRDMLREILVTADVGIVTSGTATLDAARAHLPMVIVYRVTALTYWFARLLIRGVDHFGMPNIIAGRPIVPELLQEQANPAEIARRAGELLDHPEVAERARRALEEVDRALGAPGASARAASAALEVASPAPEVLSRRRSTTGELVRRLLPYFRPHLGKLGIAIGCMLLVAGMTAVQAPLLRTILDKVFILKDQRILWPVAGAVVGVFFLKGLGDYGQSFLMQTLGRRAISDLRADLFRTLVELPLKFFHDNPTGTLLARVTYDVELVERAAVRSVVTSVMDFGTLIALTAVAFWMNWQLSLIGILVFPIAIVPIVTFGRKVRRTSRKTQISMGDLASSLHETAVGIRVVKAFRLESAMRARFDGENERIFDLLRRIIRVQALSSPLMEFLGSLGIAGVLLFGGTQVIEGGQTPGQFVAFLFALLNVYRPVKNLSKINNAVQEGLAAADRIFEVMDTASTVPEKPGALPLGRVRGAVHFDRVSFAYDREPVLESFDLAVAPGTVVALVGASGSGKSTIVNLVARFYDVQRGSITIDGQDVRDVTLASLRDQIGLVDQQTFLFNDTVRANIAFGRPGASDAEIEAAARAAHADGFIGELPRGYDTVIGEQGLRLSGGQRQRISIARAILKNPPILLLDEATSALDSASEKEVQAALNVLVKDRTTFVIAHRLSTIEHANRILVLAGGKVVEDGTHDELLARQGAYTRFYREQFRGAASVEAAVPGGGAV
jgi:subfamily B ATP-binding cassette protein MsbA